MLELITMTDIQASTSRENEKQLRKNDFEIGQKKRELATEMLEDGDKLEGRYFYSMHGHTLKPSSKHL